eukprot:scaffold32330_cov30-Tisochrysis_lutea.AAC.1
MAQKLWQRAGDSPLAPQSKPGTGAGTCGIGGPIHYRACVRATETTDACVCASHALPNRGKPAPPTTHGRIDPNVAIIETC